LQAGLSWIKIHPACGRYSEDSIRTLFMDDASRAAGYRRLAAECARLAQITTEPGLKSAYLDLEKGWLRLAKEFECEAERRRAGE
jgi:hypothetical protein